MSELKYKKIVGAVVLLVVLAVMIYGYSLYYFMPWEFPKEGLRDEPIITLVPQGAAFNKVASNLESAGLVPSRHRFLILGRLTDKDRKVQWGEYEIRRGTQPIDILNQLVSGKVKTYKITVPEGYSVRQIAILLESANLIGSQAFADYALSEAAAQNHHVPGPTLEGYLYPTTYFLPKSLKAEEIAAEMVKHYRTIFDARLSTRAKELELSEREVVTLASIIEKETGIGGERGLVASVYHNRLKKNMRLQADPTVIYGIKDYDGNITREHLQTYSPYNTYRINGLPPGPIASPGEFAIQAALYPEDTKFLYFVADKRGVHHFSVSYQEHRQKVYRYQILKK